MFENTIIVYGKDPQFECTRDVALTTDKGILEFAEHDVVRLDRDLDGNYFIGSPVKGDLIKLTKDQAQGLLDTMELVSYSPTHGFVVKDSVSDGEKINAVTVNDSLLYNAVDNALAVTSIEIKE